MTKIVLASGTGSKSVNTEFGSGFLNGNDILQEIQKQNEALHTTYVNLTDEYSTDNQKTTYLLEQIDFYKYTNSILFYIYFIFTIILCFLIFRQKNRKLYIRIGLMSIFVLYPFIISPLENLFYNNLSFISALINGNVYRRGG